MGLAPLVPSVLLLCTAATGSAAQLDWGTEPEPVLQFCHGPGECEVRQVSQDMPAKLCMPASIQPSWWAWPFMQLRLRLELVEDSLGAEQQRRTWGVGMQLQRTTPERAFCRWLGPGLEVLCRDCSEKPCAATARPILGTLDLAAYLPPRGGCVYVRQLPQRTPKVRATWEQQLDPWVAAWLLAGLVLVDCWREVSANTTVHAAIGGVGSLAFVAAMILLWIKREVLGTVHGMVPFGGTLTALSIFLFTLVPTAREALLGRVLPGSAADWYGWLSLRDPFLDLPMGWILAAAVALAACGTLSLGASMSMRYFASAPEPEGETAFTIGGDGRRIDALPPVPGPQWLLGWAVWGFGVTLLLFCSHSDSFSLAVLAVLAVKDAVAHAIWRRLMASSATRAETLRPLISVQQFEEQRCHHTRAALDQLQSYLKAHPEIVRNVREDSELRLRRFSDGGAHCPQYYEFSEHEGRGHCTVL